VVLTTHPLLAPSLRECRAIPIPPLWAFESVRDTFTFLYVRNVRPNPSTQPEVWLCSTTNLKYEEHEDVSDIKTHSFTKICHLSVPLLYLYEPRQRRLISLTEFCRRNHKHQETKIKELNLCSFTLRHSLIQGRPVLRTDLYSDEFFNWYVNIP
jgi:hypothetical protein